MARLLGSSEYILSQKSKKKKRTIDRNKIATFSVTVKRKLESMVSSTLLVAAYLESSIPAILSLIVCFEYQRIVEIKRD